MHRIFYFFFFIELNTLFNTKLIDLIDGTIGITIWLQYQQMNVQYLEYCVLSTAMLYYNSGEFKVLGEKEEKKFIICLNTVFIQNAHLFVFSLICIGRKVFFFSFFLGAQLSLNNCDRKKRRK